MKKRSEIITLVELQGILSKTMLDVLDEDKNSDERSETLATAASVYACARNFIHNASTIIRAKEIIAEGKVKDTTAINKIVG